MTNKLLHYILIFFLCAGLQSCDEIFGSATRGPQEGGGSGGGGGGSGAGNIGGVGSFQLLGTTKGQGRFRLAGTAGNGGNEAHNYHLNFELSAGEQVQFYFFASATLSGGIAMSFFRKNDGAIELFLDINGTTHRQELNLNEQILDLSLDIHNNESNTHIILWNKSMVEAKTHGTDWKCFFTKTCLYNTESFTQSGTAKIWGQQGKGSGSSWGFEGNTENILKLQKSEESVYKH